MEKNVSGGLIISNDVIADLAGNAALESYGVVGMTAPTLQDGFAKILPKARLRRGIQVENNEDGVRVDLYVVIEHGTSLAAVSQNLRDTIRFVLEDYASLKVDTVEVHVQGVRVRD